VGDDVTDEAFAAVQALGGWGIKVGEGPTMAQHRCMTAALRGWLSSARTTLERER
jgi:trehalose 6-phosphate phosphatase